MSLKWWRLALLSVALPAAAAAAAALPNPTVFEVGSGDPRYQTPRHLSYQVTVRNGTDQVAREAEVWVAAPVLRTGNQNCLRIETSFPCQLESDELGNQVLHFRLRNLAPHAARILSIRADLAMSNYPVTVEIEDRDLYLHPSPQVEGDHPEIRVLAESLGGGSDMKTARGIFRWVADNIAYAGYQSGARGALYALRSRRGDCTEYADLFAALSRAAGLPARTVAGYVYAENAIVVPEDFHNWSQVYAEGSWRVVDAQKRAFSEGQEHYIVFQILGPAPSGALGETQRLRVSPEGLTARMN